MIASYTIYYLFPRGARVNYGTLAPTAPAPAVEGALSDGAAFRLADLRGRWVLLAGRASGCDAGCESDALCHAAGAHDARQGPGPDRARAGSTRAAPHRPPTGWRTIPRSSSRGSRRHRSPRCPRDHGIWLIDPLGNLVLSYPADPDIKGLAKDLTRLLKASRIG